MGNFNKVISLRQASKISGYHQDYLSSLLRKNEIRGQKKGGNWFTTEEEIQNYMFRQKIRHKKRLVRTFLLLGKKLNTSVLYVLLCVALCGVAIYFYNKVEMQAPVAKPQFSNRTNQVNRLQF